MKDAACGGTAVNKRTNPEAVDIFFPERGQSTEPGMKICVTCSVRKECRQYARETKTTEGMWGGKIIKKE